MRPLLLLDVDGPLNPYAADQPPPGYLRHEIVEGDRSWVVHLNPQHGEALRVLTATFDLVWASSWEHGANRLLSPLLGLPQLPTILWPDRTPVARGSWKTPYVAKWVGDCPFLWVDDGVDAEDAAQFPADHQLVWPVDPRIGLTPADFAAIGKAFAANAKWPHS
ncbi:HAD domain-containing protein [Kribbella sp. NPDC005582]|uniref:HAD domain-containing protein n=1 Tax=Kribbella sp. NPDC005582 TaxID=3156893 RepID=UPI0033A40CEF